MKFERQETSDGRYRYVVRYTVRGSDCEARKFHGDAQWLNRDGYVAAHHETIIKQFRIWELYNDDA